MLPLRIPAEAACATYLPDDGVIVVEPLRVVTIHGAPGHGAIAFHGALPILSHRTCAEWGGGRSHKDSTNG